MLVWIFLMNTRRKPGLHAETLGKVLNRGAQANARGATQVLDRNSQAVAGVTCFGDVPLTRWSRWT